MWLLIVSDRREQILIRVYAWPRGVEGEDALTLVPGFVPAFSGRPGYFSRATANAMGMRAAVLAVTLCVTVSTAVLAQSGTGPFGNKYNITKLTSDVYTLTWDLVPGAPAIGNSTFIIGDHDVIVVDSGFSKAAGEAILGGLQQITKQPVSLVINTHWHGDHIFGNQVFRTAFPAARFAAHPETRHGIINGESDYRDANRPKTLARLDELRAKASRTEDENRELTRAQWQIEAWEGDSVLPELLIDSHLTVMQGTRKIEILHLGSANTKGDLVVHLPAERIAISGDMAITPVPFAFSASPRAWIEDARQAGIDRRVDDRARARPAADRSAVHSRSAGDAAIDRRAGRRGVEGGTGC